ncbi:MAG TPA: acetoacetate decarboxylase family protein [Candidatus Sulfomarinibacteraceae bacterium]|nr:acetoacetate decarboxylase family protein [Candidatus Sulfomarinibacteraceae bacterium]
MQPNTRLTPELVDNADRFTDPFFQRFRLRPAPAPLHLTDDIAKTYSFPTFYADVTCAVGIFLCDRERARALLPHPSMEPVKMPGGRAVVLFSCYEYKRVMNLAPYNEIAMTIPIMVGSGWAPPVLPLVMDLKGKGYHVFSMPVTSLENQIRGTRIWGLPKVVETITIDTEGDACTTRAADEHGDVYFELTVPKSGKSKHFDETGILYSLRDGELLRSRTCFEGNFTVSTRADLLWKAPPAPASPALRLGDSPRADVLRSLKIEPTAFQFRYSPSINSCFDLPLEP